MDTWIIVLIVIGALVLVGVLAYAVVVRGRERRTEQRREEAAGRREEAEAVERQAAERQREAEQQLARAEQERAVARGHARAADELDPDVET
jgi:F0F1-type ATP synthase membrane subunit b/b'